MRQCRISASQRYHSVLHISSDAHECLLKFICVEPFRSGLCLLLECVVHEPSAHLSCIESFLAVLRQCACHAGHAGTIPWAIRAGMEACAHLLQQAAAAADQPESSSGPVNPAAMATLLRMCWAWCLHKAACSVLPLEQRCLDLERLEAAGAAPAAAAPLFNAIGNMQEGPLPGRESNDADIPYPVPSPELSIFIGQWCAVVDQLPVGGKPGAVPTNSDLASLLDVFDGRLWHFIFHCVSTHRSIGLPSSAICSAESLMHAVCKAAGVAAADTAMAISIPSASASSAAGSLDGSEGHSPTQLSIQGNPLIDAFLGPPRGAQQAEVDTQAAGELRAFTENYHWHTGQPIEPSYLGETRQANLLAQYAGADIYAMSQCPHLRPGDRAHLLRIIHQETTPGLWRAEAWQRQKRMVEAAQVAYVKLRTKLERLEQVHATFMRNYAATLSKTVYRTPPQGNSAEGNGRAGHRMQRPVVKKVDRQRAEIQTKKLAEDMRQRSEEWAKLQSCLETYAERNNNCWDDHMFSSIDRFLQREMATSTQTFLLASCFKLQGEMKTWQMQCQSKARRLAAGTGALPDSSASMAHAITIWLLTQSLLASGKLKHTAPENNSQQALDASKAANKAVKQAMQLCRQAMQLLGFQDAATSFSTLLADFDALLPSKSKPSSRSSSRPPSATASRDSKSKPLSRSSSRPSSATASRDSRNVCHVGMSEAEFQLRFCGDILQRGVPAPKDPRVASFVPDAWQRDVLDAIDKRESCVICAPTSSGKTFISSFCMDRVVNESDDGIVVFVAPTKALVNQTAAQV